MFGRLFKANPLKANPFRANPLRANPLRASPGQQAAEVLYDAIVAQARRPSFYTACGVPDTLDGRFELVVLHAFLTFRRLEAAGAETADFAQLLFDVLFRDMDRSLREIGVGDLSVGKKVRTMAEAFYGRVKAYERALQAPERVQGGDQEGSELEAALRRNLYGTTEPKPAQLAVVADYLRRESEALAAQSTAALLAGEIVFGEAPEAPLPQAPRQART